MKVSVIITYHSKKKKKKIDAVILPIIKYIALKGTIADIINVTSKGVRLSEKLQLTAALCNEIWPQ